MADYMAPVQDMKFALEALVGLDKLAALPPYGDVAPDLVDAVLEEAAKLAAEVIGPTNRTGDQVGSLLENGAVRTPPGFREAYAQYAEAGWNALPFDPDYGGQGLPWAVAMAVQEMWQAANMSFGLCPLLNQGAVELLQTHGSELLKSLYLPRLISGEWTGTMNLTEPQAGSDLGALRCRAERDGDRYRIHGTKVFITYGDHDLADNIAHMVLARLPDAPAGVKGISLFLAPKFIPDDGGAPGRRNDIRVVSIEHKLGIMASPTCVMAFGDNDGAEAWLVGEENKGLAAMFTMMNNARLSVGLQGVAIGERALQQARDYARTRVQGRIDAAAPWADDGQGAIAEHPDIRRELLTMRALTEAGRALAYYAGGQLDLAKHAEDADARAAAQARVDLLTPVVKAWCTDNGVVVASHGVQVHGGMGFVEETGAAQLLRDARIGPIYEGTNGIQAIDLVLRKVARDGGAAAGTLLAEMAETAGDLDRGDALEGRLAASLDQAIVALREATDWLVAHAAPQPVQGTAVAAPYLALFGTVAGGWVLARLAIAARDGGTDWHRTKRLVAGFYGDAILPQATAHKQTVLAGGESLGAMPAEMI